MVDVFRPNVYVVRMKSVVISLWKIAFALIYKVFLFCFVQQSIYYFQQVNYLVQWDYIYSC